MKLINVYETSKESENRLKKLSGNKWQAKINENLSCTISIDPKRSFQTLKGFGCASTEAAGYVLSFLDKAEQKKVVKNCFSDKGNNYSFTRTHMNSCDFSLDNWACVEEKDESLDSFSFESTDKYITPLLKMAANENPKLNVMVTPWTPPAWMKNNKDMNHGGKLLKKYRGLWAKYFVRFIKGLQERGLNVGYVSIQNEPEAAQTWDSCLWTGKEEGDFAVNYLKPAFEENDLKNVKILVWDHNRDMMEKRMKQSFSVPGAEKAIDGMAYHWYSGDQYDNVRKCAQAHPGMDLFFTEGSIEGGARPGKWYVGERYGHNIINDLNAGCTAWIDWNMALDLQGGPNHVGNFCDAQILIDTKKKEVIYQNSYYYMGHFSRFILPGSKRLDFKMTPYMVPAAFDGKMGNTMECTVFKTPENQLVLVVMNRTEADMIFELKLDDLGIKDKKEKSVYTSKVTEENLQNCFVCPPRAIQTYVFDL